MRLLFIGGILLALAFALFHKYQPNNTMAPPTRIAAVTGGNKVGCFSTP